MGPFLGPIRVRFPDPRVNWQLLSYVSRAGLVWSTTASDAPIVVCVEDLLIGDCLLDLKVSTSARLYRDWLAPIVRRLIDLIDRAASTHGPSEWHRTPGPTSFWPPSRRAPAEWAREAVPSPVRRYYLLFPHEDDPWATDAVTSDDAPRPRGCSRS
jgi:hypothetical protein